MHKALAMAAVLLVAGAAQAEGLPYNGDPFHDSDFATAPLILDVAHRNAGRVDVAALGAMSFIDKYNAYLGGHLGVRYHLLDSFAFGAELGFLHGALTSIITGQHGLLANEAAACVNPTDPGCNELDMEVPDLLQVTGVATVVGVWSPLYGKVNVVSELDFNLQVYALGGVGINGTRRVRAFTLRQAPTDPLTYRLTGGGFFASGLFADPKVHGTLGVGMRFFVGKDVDVRFEVRDLFFWDRYDFGSGVTESYRSDHFFAELGVGLTLF